MLDQIKEIEPKVRYILKRYPETRNNDRLLIWKLLSDYLELELELGEKAYAIIGMVFLKYAPSFESITRCRRDIQALGDFRGKTYKVRLDEAGNVREHYRTKNKHPIGRKVWK